MNDLDRPKFLALMKGVFALHRTPLSDALVLIYFRALARYTYDEISNAFDVLTADPEAGKFTPKPGDVTRVIEGTHGDRSMIAWGKVYEAMSAVGAYQDVVFDDPAIHAAVQDAGGWAKLCRSEQKDIGFVQTTFAKAYRAYTGRGTFDYPRILSGDGGPDQAQRYASRGLPPPAPVFVGNPAMCQQVFEGGNAAGKVQISGLVAVAAFAIPHRKLEQDDQFDVPTKLIGGAQ